MKSNAIIVTAATFTLFTGEALIHYNIGIHKDPNETRKFVLPPAKDFVKIASVVLAFSVLNGLIVNQLSK